MARSVIQLLAGFNKSTWDGLGFPECSDLQV